VRRKREAEPALPEELARFVACEWPAAENAWEAVWLWTAARLQWVKAHPGGPLGDVVDVLRAGVAARRRL
jgi:hypothetical protein